MHPPRRCLGPKPTHHPYIMATTAVAIAVAAVVFFVVVVVMITPSSPLFVVWRLQPEHCLRSGPKDRHPIVKRFRGNLLAFEKQE